ncbi:MAG: EAL domain-containing protein [Lachnospiraceae bacterium]|nr:EAL domain-containing protein [Lachnospiraceae bacterium]
MAMTTVSIEKLQDCLGKEQEEYDLARIVNPYTCCELSLDGEKTAAHDTCYHIWGHSHRCNNCFSKRACVRGEVLYKTEVMGDKCYEIKSSPYRVVEENGEEKNLVIESIRISDLKKENIQMPLNNELLRASAEYLFDEVSTGIIHLDENGKVLYANKQAVRMILRGGEQHIAKLESELRNWLEGRKDGEEKPLKFVQRYEYNHKDYFFDVQLLPYVNDGKDELFIVLHEDTHGFSSRIADAQNRDKLTGIYNEEGFYRTMRRILTDHPSRKYVHFRMRVKNFALVNSLYGVRVGDALLVRLADLFRNMTAGNGCACRFYSADFGVLIEKEFFDPDSLDFELSKIKQDTDSTTFGLLFQMGICRIEDNALRPEVICDQAEMAIRYAKDTGGQMSSMVYSDELSAKELTDAQLVSRFEQALQNDEFHIFLQPQTDAEGRVKGAEALARWIRPEEGIVPPDMFVPKLEENGMIYQMDCIIWEKAARQLAKWKNTPFKDVVISVNVSPVDIRKLDIADFFQKLVEKYDVNPAMLNIEITETAMVDNPRNLFGIVDRLHQQGFKVEIDDFGSGYSSLNMLKDLNADVLKIDREFLAKTTQERKVKTILSSIINMAYELNMDVIHEGVETQEMVDMLSDMGCRMFQGFYFSKPLPVDSFEEKYESVMEEAEKMKEDDVSRKNA